MQIPWICDANLCEAGTEHQSKTLMSKIVQVSGNGVLYIFTFSVEHLDHAIKWDDLEKVEENTYYHSDWKQHFHFFSRDEILGLFPKLKLEYYTDGLTFDRRPSRLRHTGVIQYIGHEMS